MVRFLVRVVGGGLLVCMLVIAIVIILSVQLVMGMANVVLRSLLLCMVLSHCFIKIQFLISSYLI